MKTKRKIIAYIATSADGYIARPDGDVEWLTRRPRTVDYGMREFYPTIDTILLGRKTYDWAMNYFRKIGKTKELFDTKVTHYVFSKKPPRRPAPGVRFVSEPVKRFAQRLRATPGKHIWMLARALERQTALRANLKAWIPETSFSKRYACLQKNAPRSQAS